MAVDTASQPRHSECQSSALPRGVRHNTDDELPDELRREIRVMIARRAPLYRALEKR